MHWQKAAVYEHQCSKGGVGSGLYPVSAIKGNKAVANDACSFYTVQCTLVNLL